jgi:hypothetical protein
MSFANKSEGSSAPAVEGLIGAPAVKRSSSAGLRPFCCSRGCSAMPFRISMYGEYMGEILEMLELLLVLLLNEVVEAMVKPVLEADPASFRELPVRRRR